MNIPQKQQKVYSLKARAQEADKEVKRLQHIIEKSAEANGTAVDPSFHKDLVTIMEEKTPEVKKQYPMGHSKACSGSNSWRRPKQRAQVDADVTLGWYAGV